MSGTEAQVLDEIARLRPAEILIPEHATGQPHEFGKHILALGIKAITARPGWQFTPHHATEEIQRQWSVKSAGGFGFADDDPGRLGHCRVAELSAGNAKDRHRRISARCIATSSTIILHRPRQLAESGNRPHRCDPAVPKARCLPPSTAPARRMGGGCFGNGCAIRCAIWNTSPPGNLPSRRLLESPPVLKEIVEHLDDICDIERIVGRVAVGRAGPRDLAALARCVAALPDISGSTRKAPQRK